MLRSICFVMLGMEGNEDNCRTFDQTGNSAGAAGNTERIELFPGHWFDHAMEFFKIESSMSPELR